MNYCIDGEWIIDAIIRHITSDTATEFLYENNIALPESFYGVEHIECNDNRNVIIMEVKDKYYVDPINIMFDIKSGKPSVDQVYDAIYGNGRDCLRRIIMFTDGVYESDINNPSADEYVVGSLIASMNEYPLELHFFPLNNQLLQKELYDLGIFQEKDPEPKFLISDIPSEERFREAEFWNVYFDSINTPSYQSWKAFAGGIHKTSRYGYVSDINGLKIEVEWTIEGAHFGVKQTDDDSDFLKEFWQKKKGELRKLFKGNEMQFIYLPGKLPKISIKFWDFSPACLIDASVADKKDYAKTLHQRYYDLVDYMKEVLLGINESNGRGKSC